MAIFENGVPIQLVVRTHGEHSLVGRMPVHGLEVLADTPGAYILVCDERWELGQESREAVQGFLSERSELLGESQAPEKPAVLAPVPSAVPAPEAPAAPAAPAGPNIPSAPSVAPGAPPAAAPSK